MRQLKIFGTAEPRAVEQIERCAEAGDASYAVLCADNHVGYSQPIGGAVAYEHFISPSGVGYDIGCGNKAVKTPVKAAEVDVKQAMDEIVRRISFGMGRNNQEKVDDSVLDKIDKAEFAPQRRLIDVARNQLGTVGSGNHYVDLFRDEDDFLWVGVHFGSRGFGHKTASGFLALAQGLKFDEHAREGEMDSPPVLLDTRTELGQSYLEAMHLAGEYAYAGRNWVVDKVLEILGTEATEEIHNHHNFAWRETHFGRDFWVVRKGCTPAFPGQQGFVGGSMGDISVILQGKESADSREALYSTVHGAGRVMSRTQAAGKTKRFKNDEGKWDFRVVKPGLVDWEQERTRVWEEQGVHIRGGGADEAPPVYKRLPDVLNAHKGTIEILHTLEPVGVAMAGRDVFDPYKD